MNCILDRIRGERGSHDNTRMFAMTAATSTLAVEFRGEYTHSQSEDAGNEFFFYRDLIFGDRIGFEREAECVDDQRQKKR